MLFLPDVGSWVCFWDSFLPLPPYPQLCLHFYIIKRPLTTSSSSLQNVLVSKTEHTVLPPAEIPVLGPLFYRPDLTPALLYISDFY